MLVTTDRCREATTCRAGGGALREVLNLGSLHLSAFLQVNEAEPPSYPLVLTVGEKSGLIQLKHTVDHDLLYRNYWYRSGTNETMVKHLVELMHTAASRANLQPGDISLDIGCNDGTLLNAAPEGVYTIGFDPSNIQPEGIDEYIPDFFSPGFLGQRRAKVVTSIAMFYDLDNPVEFAQNVADVLTEDGLWVCEMHYSRAMINTFGFDAICHEHLAYYDLCSLEFVLDQVGLKVIDVERNVINGGSFRAYIAKHGTASIAVDQMRQIERQNPIDFVMFERGIRRQRDVCRAMLHNLKNENKLVLGYGASTKGSTIAQYYGITQDLMPVIADRNPLKWGLYCSGTGIPVISEEAARKMEPDVFFAFPYHFIEGFLKRETEHLARGGKFMITVPQPRLLP